jgi:signal transduction histidine kinase/CheY-like chemotaxis protein
MNRATTRFDYGDRLRAARPVVIACAVFAIAGGALTLVGWATASYRLTDWWATGISMKANPSVAAIAAGFALILSQRRGTTTAVHLLGGFIALVGGLTLLQHVAGLDLGIDTLLFDEPAGARATAAPGRMGPPASTSFALTGIALMLTQGGPAARRSVIALATIVACLAGIALCGYLFHASQLFAVARLTGISTQMASIVFVIAIGLFASIPEQGPTAILRADDEGGLLARRLLLPVAVLPLGLGWLAVQGEQRGYLDTAFGAAAFTIIMVVALSTVVLTTAHKVGRSSAAQRESDRRKDVFLAVLAHELRNPLAPVLNSVEVLKRPGLDHDRRIPILQMLDRQLRHLVRLVDDLLDVSRISRDRLEIRRERVALSEVLRDAIESCQPSIVAAGQELLASSSGDPLFVHGDRVRLAQSFGNLLHNANKYTPDEGRIELRVRRDGDAALVSVRDNGVGISPEVLARLFEMFTQGSAGTDRSRGGLGIGLSLARRLIELHGGSLTASSAGNGQGSEFVVRLPLHADQSVVVSSAGVSDGGKATTPTSRRVLVVDDNADAASSLADLLELDGHQVEMASDGVQGIARARAFVPDLILLDIGLPTLDGYETCRAIRAESWGTMPIAAVTGWGQDADRERALEAGFDHHLVKPVSFDAVKRLLEDDGADSRRRGVARRNVRAIP